MNAKNSLSPPLLPDWNPSPARHDFDMDDAPDLPAFKHGGTLAQALEFIQETVWPAFDGVDKDALMHQKRHKWLAGAAAVGGSLAVLFGILQLGLPKSSQIEWLRRGEVIAAVVAIAAVSFGLWASAQFQWLLQRHRAERLRGLKFLLLLQADLWCWRSEEWKSQTRRKVASISALNRDALAEWAEQDHVSVPSADLARCAIEPNTLRMLASYYLTKRLDVQMNYFGKRSGEFTGRDRLLRNWPAWCFYGSVFAAFLHFLTDAFGHGDENAHSAALTLMLLAVALPVIGASVRTVRLASEFGRSASIYRAKHTALQSWCGQLLDELGSENLSSERILRLIAACEDFLEAEHREWLRLMREAEWFG